MHRGKRIYIQDHCFLAVFFFFNSFFLNASNQKLQGCILRLLVIKRFTTDLGFAKSALPDLFEVSFLSFCLYLCIYVCMYVYMCVHTCVFIYVCMFMHECECVVSWALHIICVSYVRV